MTTIVVAGALANKAGNGGEAWVRSSWVRGFAALGAEVHLLEEIGAATCVDAGGRAVDVEDSVNLAFFRMVTCSHGIPATLLVDDGRAYGTSRDTVRAIASGADLLVNISGHLRDPDLLSRFGRRAYVDLDPGFTQLWHAGGCHDLGIADHHLHFTVGERIGTAACDLPTAGVRWMPTRQPVLLDDWPVVPVPTGAPFTTVGSWRGAFGPVEHRGRTLGVKAHEFRKYLDLPHRVHVPLELALDIHPADGADRRRLVEHGWRLVAPGACASTPDAFRAYVARSAGEWSVAQEVYVATRSGWFSDRTVRYLASGRPVVVQDTGFGGAPRGGLGLVTFSNLEEAVTGLERVAADPLAHGAAARRIAERCFAADVVLARFLEDAGVRV